MTDVEICSNACVRLGVDSFASFDADTNAANASAAIYEQVKTSILSRHNWHFTIRQAQLSREVTTPTAKWTYQYILPVDRLGNAPMEVFLTTGIDTPYKEWEIVGDRLMSNATALYCAYVADLDEADMPAYFVELLIKAMMLELCIPLLGKDSVGIRQTLNAEVWGDFGEFQKAKTADSRNHPPIESKDFELLSARWGRGYSRAWG